MKNAQGSLFEFAGDHASNKRYGSKRARTTHGGVFGKDGRHTGRKYERPISTKHAHHIVLKSDKARGKLSFQTFQNSIAVKKIIQKQASKFGVIIQDFANGGNHLHIKARWLGLAFSRVLKTRKEEMILEGYFEANRKEVTGRSRKEGLQRRADYLEEFSEWVVGMTNGRLWNRSRVK